jgi:hypothetical protein
VSMRCEVDSDLTTIEAKRCAYSSSGGFKMVPNIERGGSHELESNGSG